MKRQSRSLISLLVVLLLHSSPSLAESQLSRASQLVIPANVPLSGPFATYGTAIQEGAELALDDVKASSPEGVPIAFDWQDNEGKPARTVTVLREQLRANPIIYISGVRPQTMAIWDEVARLRIPHFVWIFDRSIEKNGAPDFRTFVNFKVEPPLFLHYSAAKQMKRIAVIYVKLPHTDEVYQNAVLPGFKEQGATLLVEAYDLNQDDFRDIAAKVRSFSPDGIFLCGFPNHLVSLVKSFRTLRLIHDGNTVASYDMLDAGPLLPAEEIEGIRFSAPSFLFDGEESRFGKWRARFRELKKHEPLYTSAYGYDMGMVLVDAVKRAKEKTPEALTKALRETDLVGLSGRLRFDQGGDLDVPVELGVFHNGKAVRDTDPPGKS